MSFLPAKAFGTVATLIWLLVASNVTAEVRLSFLNESIAREDTIRLITNNGCIALGAEVLNRGIESYYSYPGPLRLDLRKFPKPEDGFYAFASMKELVAALPHRLCETDHPWWFNCFDAVITASSGKLRINLQPDENFGPFMVSSLTTNEEQVSFAATARDAFSKIYHSWYSEATSTMMPEHLRDSRISLTATLFRWRLLPTSTKEKDLDKSVMKALTTDWQRAGVTFPKDFQIILCHKVDLKSLTICTVHAGMLFRHGNKFTWIEKSGGSGPFVRLDFREKSELLTWLMADFKKPDRPSLKLFATFNDLEIQKIE